MTRPKIIHDMDDESAMGLLRQALEFLPGRGGEIATSTLALRLGVSRSRAIGVGAVLLSWGFVDRAERRGFYFWSRTERPSDELAAAASGRGGIHR